MTINKLLLAVVSLMGLMLLWLVVSSVFGADKANAAATPPQGAGARAETAAVAHLLEIANDPRLVGAAGLETIVGVKDARLLSANCVAALTRRGDQLRRNPHLIDQPPTLPAPSEDSCNAAGNASLIGVDMRAVRDRPQIRAQRFRLLSQTGAAWVNHDVRSECATWLEPERLNFEDANMRQRMWCG